MSNTGVTSHLIRMFRRSTRSRGSCTHVIDNKVTSNEIESDIRSSLAAKMIDDEQHRSSPGIVSNYPDEHEECFMQFMSSYAELKKTIVQQNAEIKNYMNKLNEANRSIAELQKELDRREDSYNQNSIPTTELNALKETIVQLKFELECERQKRQRDVTIYQEILQEQQNEIERKKSMMKIERSELQHQRDVLQIQMDLFEDRRRNYIDNNPPSGPSGLSSSCAYFLKSSSSRNSPFANDRNREQQAVELNSVEYNNTIPRAKSSPRKPSISSDISTSRSANSSEDYHSSSLHSACERSCERKVVGITKCGAATSSSSLDCNGASRELFNGELKADGERTESKNSMKRCEGSLRKVAMKKTDYYAKPFNAGSSILPMKLAEKSTTKNLNASEKFSAGGVPRKPLNSIRSCFCSQ